MKLATRLTLLFLVLSMVPTAIVGYLGFENGRRTIMHESMNHLVSVNTFKSQDLERWIEQGKKDMEEVAQRPIVRQHAEVLARHESPDLAYRKARQDIVEDHLRPRLKAGGFFELFLMCPRHGHISASTDERQEGKFRDTSPYYMEGKNRSYVQAVYYSPELEQPAMTISAPVTDKQGSLVGVLAGRLDLGELSNIIALQSGGHLTEDTYLVNTFNFFVTEPRSGQGYALKKAVPTEGVEAGLSGKDGVGFYKDYRGVPVIGAYKWLPAFNMCIITEIDEDEAFAPVVRLAWIIAGIASAISIAAGLLGLFFARTITRPVLRLAAGAEEIGAGNLECRVGTASKDEIGALSRAFDRMAESLKRITVSRDDLIEEIEKRKLAEKTLREISSRQEAILVAVPDIMMEVDVNKVYTWANQPGIAFFGRDVMGKEAAFYFEGEQVTYDVVQPLFDGDENVIYVESWQRRVDGEKRLLAWWCRVLKDDSGQVTGALSSARDITERKRAEESLRQSEEKYRRIFENSVVGFFQSSPEGRFDHVNPAFARMLGYESPGDLVSTISDISRQYYVNPEDRCRYQQILQEQGYVENFEFKARCKDGIEIWVSNSTRAYFGQEGKVVHYAGIVIDITKRKRAEEEKEKLQEQLRQSQKLEAVGRLTGGIAHDFNNLLTTIIGNAEMALMDLDKKQPLYEVMAEINEAGKRAASLTRQLLAFSRKQIIQPEILDLNEVVRDMDKMLRRLLGENIEPRTILSPDLGRVEADVGQIEQVIMNLAVNARDAMPSGGKLTIETANVELDEAYAGNHVAVEPGPYVMLAVSDTGVGMTTEVQAQIFEPFFTTKEKGKGTGLGLSTVYGIVKQSKGNIWVYSEPGQGTTLKIYLPRVEKTGRVVEKAERGEEGLTGSETILVVEDDEILRTMALRVLGRYGYAVHTAPDGREALRISREHEGSIDLVLTDVVMPGMSGRDLAEELQRMQPGLKVLFMSGYTDEAIVHHGILEKGIAFIQKPFTPEGLARKVREVLERNDE